MRITVEAHDNKHIFQCEYDDITATKLLDIFCGLMLSMGYHSHSVMSACADYAYENCPDNLVVDFDKEGSL